MSATRRLKASGWQLRGMSRMSCQFYHARLDPDSVEAVVLEIGLVKKAYIIGGDFMVPGFLGRRCSAEPGVRGAVGA